MSAILEVKNLNLGFNLSEGFSQAIYDVSFSLNKGETLAIVGESGCGKTISTMSVLQLLPQTAQIKSGEIIYNGENLLSFNQKQMQKIRGKKIALIPQDPMTSLNPLYTIGNQMLEIIELHQNVKGKEAFNIAVEALERVKIPDAKAKMKSYPHEFSGGMKQRVIIAMALACNAEIIIADEPTTALDVTVQAQIMEILRDVKEKFNMSVILITHDLGIVAQNADKIAVMYAGRVVEYAPVDELFNDPKHPYTKALLNVILDINTDKVETIEGQPPSVTDDIKGCPFHPRCKYCMEICTHKEPELKMTDSNRKVACHLYS
ncbi:MAG: ABC transporter ATP-binding protein [Opitutales bacterium]|jgi:oligopeptide/dipeptide ABC transporter, ATP-binding protein, C-terminal domain|nr:ABC transporter ATP-binding protein [Clostridium sp.]